MSGIPYQPVGDGEANGAPRPFNPGASTRPPQQQYPSPQQYQPLQEPLLQYGSADAEKTRHDVLLATDHDDISMFRYVRDRLQIIIIIYILYTPFIS